MSRQSGLPIATASVDIGDLAQEGSSSATITVPGAKVGDFVLLSADADLEQGQIYGQVLSANTVEWQYYNDIGDSGDLTAFTLRVKVIPYENL